MAEIHQNYQYSLSCCLLVMFAIMFDFCQFYLNNATETDLKINYCSQPGPAQPWPLHTIAFYIAVDTDISLLLFYNLIMYLELQWKNGIDLVTTRPEECNVVF